jgi:hypothetical protein
VDLISEIIRARAHVLHQLYYLLQLRLLTALGLAASGVSGMQPHSAFHRHTFSIPNPSRRFTSSSPRQPTRPTPFSKILLSALTVTAGKTIVLDGEKGYGGGAGWLTLAFWAGRIISEARNEWKQRSEGKGKERERNETQLGPVSQLLRFWNILKRVEDACCSRSGAGSAVYAVYLGSQRRRAFEVSLE